MDKNRILELIDDKISDVEYSNCEPRCCDEYYMKNDAKIQVLYELRRDVECED